MGCGPSKDTPVVDASKPQGAPVTSTKKAEDEKLRLERIGVSPEPLPDFTPSPCFVIKSKRTNTHQKAFINVFHHDSVPTTTRYVTRNEQWKVDRKGDQVCVFTCVIPSSEYAHVLKDPVSHSALCVKVISLINDIYPVANLDMDYILPKIHAGYIGEGIDLISSDPNAPKYAPVPAAAAPTEPVAPAAAPAVTVVPMVKKAEAPAAKPAPATAPALVNPHLTLQKSQAAEKDHLLHAPPKMQGWLKKKGHIVINWKTRYFVLDSGYLTYYVDQLDEPPYGKDRKGQICLAGYRTVHSGTHGTNTMGEDNGSPEFQCRIQLLLMNNSFQERSGRTADYPEVMIEAPSQEEKHAWLAALAAHIHYVESSLTIAAQVEQKVNNGDTSSGAAGRSLSTANAGAGGGVVVTSEKSDGNIGADSATPVTTTLTATNDPKQWMVYVDSLHHETIVLCGQVNKPNPMGKVMIRELILTSRKRLVYVDTKTLEQKGELDWNTASVEPFVKLVNATTFEVHHVDENKVYKFITKDELTAQHWADAINSVKPAVRKA